MESKNSNRPAFEEMTLSIHDLNEITKSNSFRIIIGCAQNEKKIETFRCERRTRIWFDAFDSIGWSEVPLKDHFQFLHPLVNKIPLLLCDATVVGRHI